MAQFGAQTAFKRSLPFSEAKVLAELVTYLKKSVNLVDVEVLPVKEALNVEGLNKSIIEGAEPGSPTFEFRNV